SSSSSFFSTIFLFLGGLLAVWVVLPVNSSLDSSFTDPSSFSFPFVISVISSTFDFFPFFSFGSVDFESEGRRRLVDFNFCDSSLFDSCCKLELRVRREPRIRLD
ncbi:hypothetical protein PFISCL1PPCAC_14941, partial [Pristionchus fissidentatus]